MAGLSVFTLWVASASRAWPTSVPQAVAVNVSLFLNMASPERMGDA